MKKLFYALVFMFGILAGNTKAQHFKVKTDSLVYKEVDGYSFENDYIQT